jgi:type I restriction enzyme M protein
MAFLQHMVASVNENGRLVVVLPNGVFFRGGAELAVRKDLIDADLVEAIVQLPADLFYGAGIPACVLVLNRAKPNERRGRVLMIDNSTGFERRDTKNVLTTDAIERVIASYKSGDEVDGLSKWVADEEIATHHFNLVVRRFVGSGEMNGKLLDLDDTISAYREARAA